MGTEEFTIASANRGGKSIQLQVSGAVSSTFENGKVKTILKKKRKK